MRGNVVPLTEERDVETLRQISLLLERENQRLITKNLQLTAELARLRGLPEIAQFTFAVEQSLQQTRAAILDRTTAPPRRPRPGPHGRDTARARNPPCRSSRCGTSCRRISVDARPAAEPSPSWSGSARRLSASPP